MAQKLYEVMAYQLVVDCMGHNDVMPLVCELNAGASIEAAMKEILRVSGDVPFQKPGSLPQGCKVIDDCWV